MTGASAFLVFGRLDGAYTFTCTDFQTIWASAQRSLLPIGVSTSFPFDYKTGRSFSSRLLVGVWEVAYWLRRRRCWTGVARSSFPFSTRGRTYPRRYRVADRLLKSVIDNRLIAMHKLTSSWLWDEHLRHESGELGLEWGQFFEKAKVVVWASSRTHSWDDASKHTWHIYEKSQALHGYNSLTSVSRLQ